MEEDGKWEGDGDHAKTGTPCKRKLDSKQSPPGWRMMAMICPSLEML